MLSFPRELACAPAASLRTRWYNLKQLLSLGDCESIEKAAHFSCCTRSGECKKRGSQCPALVLQAAAEGSPKYRLGMIINFVPGWKASMIQRLAKDWPWDLWYPGLT